MMLYIGLGMIIFGLAAIAVGFFFRNKAKQILAAPFRKTVEAAGAAGLTSCEGAVRTGQPLTAPCSGRPCAYYQLEVQQQVKETRGSQTQTSWKQAGEHHAGSVFYLDDGSGPLVVIAQEKLDADLTQTFSGPPPGGPGLGAIAGLIQPVPHGRGDVLGYKVVEKIIGVDAPLFAMGEVQGGRMSGKLTVSTRGRDGLVGAKKRLAAIALAAGGVIAAAGVPVMILRPGEAKTCGPLQDGVAECAIASTEITIDETKPDGKVEKVTLRQSIHAWKVTKAGAYELSARTPSKKSKPFPRIQVENEIGFPVNIGVNWGIGGDSAHATSTKTANLEPGTYKIYVWSDKGSASRLLLKIAPAAEKSATR